MASSRAVTLILVVYTLLILPHVYALKCVKDAKAQYLQLTPELSLLAGDVVTFQVSSNMISPYLFITSQENFLNLSLDNSTITCNLSLLIGTDT